MHDRGHARSQNAPLCYSSACFLALASALALARAFLCFKIVPEIRLRLRLGLALLDAGSGAVGSGATSSSAVVDSAVGAGGSEGVGAVGAGAARTVVGAVISVVVMLVSSLRLCMLLL